MGYFRGKRFLDTLPDRERGRPALGPVEHYLPRLRCLLTRLDDPQASTRSIIVGGTNGKGTVSSLLCDLLQAAGLLCGLYTSPHLRQYSICEWMCPARGGFVDIAMRAIFGKSGGCFGLSL